MVNIEDIPEETPSEFVYLLVKAERYLEVGPEAYRAGDFFKMPREDCSGPLLAAIQRGMEQICQFHGWSRDKPFENLGIDGFYALLATLHFEMVQQRATDWDEDTFLDEMHMRHRVTGQEIVLYNIVPKPIVRRK